MAKCDTCQGCGTIAILDGEAIPWNNLVGNSDQDYVSYNNEILYPRVCPICRGVGVPPRKDVSN